MTKEGKPPGKGKKPRQKAKGEPHKVSPEDLWPDELTKLQAKLGLTNQEMAARMGVSLTTYQGWKYRQRPIPPIAQKLIEEIGKGKK